MSDNFDKFKFNNYFKNNQNNQYLNLEIHETQQVSDNKTENKLKLKNDKLENDYLENDKLENGKLENDIRTEDQVRNDLNFSIDNLLNKLSKATAAFEQPSKIKSEKFDQDLIQFSRPFKVSHLSSSTKAASSKQRSYQYKQNYQSSILAKKKRESQPNQDNDKEKASINQNCNTSNFKFGENKLQNYSLPKKNTNAFDNQSTKNVLYFIQNESQDGPLQSKNSVSNLNSRPNSLKTFDSSGKITSAQKIFEQSVISLPFVHQKLQCNFHQAAKKKYEHQPEQKISSINQISCESNERRRLNLQRNQIKSSFEQKKQLKNIPQSSDLVYPWLNSENLLDWNRPLSKAQIQLSKFQLSKNLQMTHKLKFSPDRSQKQIKSGNKLKTQASFQLSVNNQTQKEHKEKQSKTQSTKPQPKSQNRFQSLTFSTSKKEIALFFGPYQTSAFGKNPNQILNKQKKTKNIVDSIIIEGNSQAKHILNTSLRPVYIVNSLFDKTVRQVAASRIIESPKGKFQNPFLQICKNDVIQQQKTQNCDSPNKNAPIIRINTAQKSKNNLQKESIKLTVQDFQLGKQLGSGKFGDVYQAIHKKTGLLFAIKKIFKSTILEYDMVEQFTRELKIHYLLDYPNIIKLYTHFDDEYHIFLVMEYGEGGTLMEKVKTGEKFASIIMEQMLRAVEYLHGHKVAHRDIKPENIVLIFSDTAKMCDFGWSRVFDSDMKKTFCGTLDYVSPEMKDKGEYSLKIDVWSLGVLTFELLLGYAPFKDQIIKWRRKGGNLNKSWNWNILYPPELSSMAESFMRNLLKQDPDQRANIRFCLNHLFIRKYNHMKLDKQEDLRFRQITNILKDQV